MMRANLNHAIFSAIITFIVSFPLLGLNLVTGGTSMSIEGADTTTFTYIAAAVAIVFFFQLFHDKIMGVFSHIPTPEVGHLYSDLPQSKKNSVEKWFTIALVALAIIWPFFVSRGSIDLATLVLIYVMLGLGLNIVVGLAGLLDLGYVAFYAVGAYSYALLSEYFGLSFWVALPIGGLMAALFGFLLGFPVLRLRGDYLAIVTLGFGEIIRIVLLNSTSVTGGPNGIGGIDKPTLFGMEFGRRVKEEGNTLFHEVMGIPYDSSYKVIFLYLLAVILVVFTVFVIRRLVRMPVGRAWEALREDEIACRSLGMNRTIIKLSAFTIGAAFAGFAGCFFAARQGFISPESFTFIESAIILAIVVLGGMGSQLGVILAAVAMTVLPEIAREFQEYRMLMFGLMMVLMMVWRPQGLLPSKRPHMELAND
ncbi:high-affinity branched-chain amino acid ABC transporter permease LivM [Oleiphilus sp. HI0071]|nr:high-affinity branched-chain amino acid ABC transporter permease LivM [Oleiphilus sp. HI0065]KZY82157.1 high-affinity branched-chain amino acid ABC transporter permease LivM [Oleiphilus sp. HI0071]KZZ00802.1 high-affinity branched-chain amino acid ABC transporter permease LivM [Oleiphilus sp. HI0073]KZZ18387.1 high-affinity branched-chain amino acid ABC transporter permease LivM [Oleiphilus sp. HI0080]KZZ44346.1 high-affinity branched-chain amino acid ABC transporter permease LivM [Oleiphilu